MHRFMIERRSAGLASIFSALLLVFATACGPSSAPEGGSGETAANVTVYEGARVIVGDGQVIENAVFTVDDTGQIAAVGAAADVSAPDGATRVDLSGRTVIPALVDAHVHLSTTRDALIEDLERRAYYGIGAALSLGHDGPDVPLEVRDELIPGAARYRSAGRGITRPEPARSEVPHWVDTPDEARQAVRDEAAREVDFIKIWVDDRNGRYEKIGPDLYTAVIDEAHQNDVKVTAHIFTLEDAKGLVEAGIDAFAHGVRDTDVDDAFVALIKENANVVLVPNMPYRGVPADLDWLAGSMPAEALEELKGNMTERPEAQESWGIQGRNLDRLSREGMTIAMGTDGNNAWAPHVEMEDMVAAGMSPADVIVAATKNSAELVGISEMGTLSAGKSADFVVLEANPLDDITNTRRIVDVYLRGERVDRAALAARFAGGGASDSDD